MELGLSGDGVGSWVGAWQYRMSSVHLVVIMIAPSCRICPWWHDDCLVIPLSSLSVLWPPPNGHYRNVDQWQGGVTLAWPIWYFVHVTPDIESGDAASVWSWHWLSHHFGPIRSWALLCRNHAQVLSDHGQIRSEGVKWTARRRGLRTWAGVSAKISESFHWEIVCNEARMAAVAYRDS